MSAKKVGLVLLLGLAPYAFGGRTVAVMGFREVGAEAKAALAGAALTEEVIKALERSPYFRPLPRLREAEALPDIIDPLTAVELGRKVGADVLVDGNVLSLGQGAFMANARFVDTKAGELALTPSLEASGERALKEIASRIVAQLEGRFPLTAPIAAVISEEGRAEVAIAAGSKQGVKVGDRFSICEKGAPIVNPATGENFGAELESIGVASVYAVEPTQCWAKVSELEEEISIRNVARLVVEPEGMIPANRLIISSKPAGAFVFVGDLLKGATPVSVEDIPVGRHKFRLKIEGYEEFEGEAEVREGEVSIAFTHLLAIPPRGVIRVSSEPPGALVILDGKEVGLTPIEIPAVPVGRRGLALKLEGYKPHRLEVEVEPRKVREVRVRLEPLLAKVRFETEPDGARIFLSRKFLGLSPVEAELPVGEHELIVELEGYARVRRRVAIEPGEQKVGVILESLLGTITVRSSPPGATVTVGDREMGKTPISFKASMGPHKLVVTLFGYEPYVAEVNVRPEKESFVDAILERQYGRLKVETDPPGATVIFEGREMGKSPVTVEKAPVGEHKVMAKLAGYYPGVTTILVEEGKEAIARITLRKVVGRLHVATTPEGANLYIEGVLKGKTPLELMLIPGKYRLRVEKQGYRAVEQEVEVPKEGTFRVSLELERKRGTLKVESVPEGASVFVEGEFAGTTPFEAKLEEGEHEVQIRKSGYLPFVRRVRVEDRRTTELQALLRPEEAGTLVVLSEPAEVSVQVGGREAGVTPLTVPGLSVGVHRVTLTKQGYQAWTGEVEIKANQTSQLFVKLKPLAPPPPARPPSLAAVFGVEGPQGKGNAKALVYIGPELAEVHIELPWATKVKARMVSVPRHLALDIPKVKVIEQRVLWVNVAGLIKVLVRPLSDMGQILFYLTPAGQVKVTPGDRPNVTRVVVSKRLEMPKGVLTQASKRGNFYQVGLASWYGGRFHGRRTASGRLFNQYALTAAHRRLPFGTKVEVVRLNGEGRTVVTITDRGPYRKGRVIDLSRGAAARLGTLRKGIARVGIRILKLPSRTRKISAPP